MKRRFLSPVRAIIAILFAAVTIFPVFWMLLIAIRPSSEMMGGNVSFFPQSLTAENFISLFTQKDFLHVLTNSAIVTGFSLLISLAFGIAGAYILSRDRFRFHGKRALTYWVLLVRILPPIAFAVPLYIMFSKLNWLRTLLPEICACVFINLPLIIWFLVSFFQEIPIEMEESSKIDGATEWQIFYRIVMPLIMPGIAAVAMLSFVYAWNEYTYSVIFIQSASNYTVPISLTILNTEDNIMQYGLVAAGSIVSVIPMAVFVIFAQRYLISGLSSGAVKG